MHLVGKPRNEDRLSANLWRRTWRDRWSLSRRSRGLQYCPFDGAPAGLIWLKRTTAIATQSSGGTHSSDCLQRSSGSGLSDELGPVETHRCRASACSSTLRYRCISPVQAHQEHISRRPCRGRLLGAHRSPERAGTGKKVSIVLACTGVQE